MANDPLDPTMAARLNQILYGSSGPIGQDGRLLDISTGAPGSSLFQQHLQDAAGAGQVSSNIEDRRGIPTIAGLIARHDIENGPIASGGFMTGGPGPISIYGGESQQTAIAPLLDASLAATPDPANDIATKLIKDRESYRSKAYWDRNAWRVGYGSDTVTYADGSVHPVKKTTVTSKTAADRDLARRIPEFQNQGVIPYVGQAAWDALPPETKAAVTSLAYNYGSISELPSLQRAIQSGDPQAVAGAILDRSADNDGINADRRQYEAGIAAGHPIPMGAIPDVGTETDTASAFSPLPTPVPLTPESMALEAINRAAPPASETAVKVADALGFTPQSVRTVPPASVTADKTDALLKSLQTRSASRVSPPPASETAKKTNDLLDTLANRAAVTTGQPQPGNPANGFNTILPPEMEKQYQEWKKQVAPNDSGEDYDFRGAFATGTTPAENGHWPDTFKKPNEPTFSKESLYAPYAPGMAGTWNGDQYTPGPLRAGQDISAASPARMAAPLPFSGPLTASAPSTVQIPMPQPRPAPTPAQAASMPPLTLPLNAPLPDGRGSSYGSEANQWAPSIGNLGAPSVLDLLPSAVPATTLAQTRAEQGNTRYSPAVQAPVAAPLSMPAPTPPQGLAEALRSVIGADQSVPPPKVTFVPSQGGAPTPYTGPAATAADFRPWQQQYLPASATAPEGPNLGDQVMGGLESIFGSPAQAAQAPSLMGNKGDIGSLIEAMQGPKATNSSGSPDDRGSRMAAPTLLNTSGSSSTVSAPGIKTITETVPNPDYDAWLKEQTKPRGDQIVTTSTGAPITRSMQDAMSYVGPDAYQAPIVHAPVVKPVAAPPKTITRTRTVTVPGTRSVGGTTSSRPTVRQIGAGSRVDAPVAAANPLADAWKWANTPLWGKGSDPNGGINGILAQLFGGGGAVNSRANVQGGVSAPMVNISAAPAGSPAAGLLAKNGGGLGENAMVSFRPGTETRWTTGY